ncbi:hypothetical protein AWB82_06394 [Caballeronia glebae]|uniref:Uncharacterized protein n=1 Tax=Caballeronia glebae TaxID=1777143 RepID=A0A158D7W2_9BURK|nr:hypothetical protein [Caballeronia glebae]SAK90752.1 hypothetical protein AWB82_06394 [Caballeronia glebae]
MKVYQLIRRLSRAHKDATVLLLSAVADYAEEVRFAYAPTEPWIHEQHRRPGQAADDYFRPSTYGPAFGFDETTDTSSLENVVVLASEKNTLDLVRSETARSGRLSMDDVRDAALDNRRAMLSSGELLRESEFRKRLGVTNEQLATLLGRERVFALDVDGESAYPAILCDPELNLKRLWKLASIVAPASASERLDFLTSESGALGKRRPVQMLESNKDYRKVRAFAAAWMTEFSRTFVKILDAQQQTRASLEEPIYTTAAEGDPRLPLWKRALLAVSAPGFRFPHEVPRCPASALIVVERHTAGVESAQLEARIVCDIDEEEIRVSASTEADPPLALKLNNSGECGTVVEVAERVFRLLAKQ